jgi:pimeloyl-ACP methyl ester carboxylesterase
MEMRLSRLSRQATVGRAGIVDDSTPGALWPSSSRSRTVDVDGPVRLTEYGDPRAAEVIVCLHGLGGSALNFGLVAPLLAEGRRVLVPDLLGHGHSYATAPNEPGVDSQLRMLSLLLARETRHPVVLVGHSMGGILAMMHAARLPESVKGLVLLDPPVPNVTRWSRDPRLTVKLALSRVPGVAALVARQVAALTPSNSSPGICRRRRPTTTGSRRR